MGGMVECNILEAMSEKLCEHEYLHAVYVLSRILRMLQVEEGGDNLSLQLLSSEKERPYFWTEYLQRHKEIQYGRQGCPQ
jgi:hypothetical protein